GGARGDRTHPARLLDRRGGAAAGTGGGDARRRRVRRADALLPGRTDPRLDLAQALGRRRAADAAGLHAGMQGRALGPVLRCCLAGPEGFGAPTPKFVAWCSIQLSYGRVAEAELCRLGCPVVDAWPADVRVGRNWRRLRDSNPRWSF